MLTNPKLVRTPDVCGGRLRLEGTRMTVNQIITLFKQGSSVEEILEQYPRERYRRSIRSFRGTSTIKMSSTEN